MDQRGFTLIELVIALSVGSVILLAMGGFYVSMLGVSNQANAQVFLARQGTLILEELARRIRPATALPPWSCGPRAAAASLAFQEEIEPPPETEYLCIYQERNQIFVCEIEPNFTTNPPSKTGCVTGRPRNLLSGSPISLRASNVTFTRLQGGGAVAVSFVLQDAAGALTPLSFGIQVAVRN